MIVWLITVGEPLPTDAVGVRLLRTGMLSRQLVSAGHDVLWWTSSFDHVRKQHRTAGEAWVQDGPRLRIRLLRSHGYRKNVSLQRLIDHRGLARNFAREAPTLATPDVILCSLPTLELCDEAVAYGRRVGAPVVLDIRDLWPDVFLDLAPPGLRPVVDRALWPLWRLARRACSGATAIVGITEQFVEWGIQQGRRKQTSLDRVFPMAYQETKPSPDEIDAAEAYWRSLGLARDPEEFVVCFFGSINRHFEIPTVIEAARLLAAEGRKVKFVLCGDGERLGTWRTLADECAHVLFPGWVDAPKIWTLMRMANAGIAPYVTSSNFVGNLPNKPIEYLSAGLPILSSLQGVLAGLLARHECGLTYANGDARGLAAAVAGLIDHPDLQRRMAENAARIFRAQFVAETVYRNMAEYLGGLAAERQSAAA